MTKIRRGRGQPVAYVEPRYAPDDTVTELNEDAPSLAEAVDRPPTFAEWVVQEHKPKDVNSLVEYNKLFDIVD